MNRIIICISILFINGLISINGFAQSDSKLSVNETILRVLETYPSVKQAEEAINTASYNIKMAESAFLPIINGSASYNYIDPNPVMKLHGERFAIEPKHNYDAHISISQLIYDFGKNRPKIDAAKLKKEVSLIQQDEIYQSLALNAVRLYYMNCFARKAIQIKIQELGDYEEMLRQVEIRTSSGSATSFDLLNTKVSKSAVTTQMTGLTANLRSLQTQLSVLMDSVITETIPLEEQLIITPQSKTLDQLLQSAYDQRPEMLMVSKQVAIAQLEETAARRSYNPSLDLSASAGGKDGYPNALERMRLNVEAGVSLSIPLYEGGRRKQTNALARSAYNTALYQKEIVIKELTQEVSENYYSLISDFDKTEQLTFQVMLAEEAYKQAKVNYAAGAITNLELLTSSTNLSASKLQLLQAQVNYLINDYQLKVSIGEKIW